MTQKKKWEEVYYDWKSSGQTQRDYCKTKGIPFGRFKNHTYKLGISARESKFKEIEIRHPEKKEHPYCEIKFEGQHRITVESRESLMYLKQLIRSMAHS